MTRNRKDTTILTELAVGSEARVTAVNGEGRVTNRLLEMGVVPGATVSVVKSAPFGDPIQVRVKGYSLAMRRSEAEMIEVAE
ncbi:MAG TPA: ferrous iron transport protein A [Pyrinomonadaceae bacterium]|nr:ferrous iron transport protein A [Pyrinomonadaceae bacterium]